MLFEKYYKGQKVTIVDHFEVGGIDYAKIQGAKVDQCVVKRAELTDEKPKESTEPQIKEATQVQKVEDDAPKSRLIVTATKNNSVVGEFNNVRDSEFKKFVEDKKLSLEAIQNVLDGGQKSHKGYTFSEK